MDKHVGLIRTVEESPRDAGAPAYFHYYARACNTGAFCHQSNFGNTGGASTSREIALCKAVGEAIERYCSAIYEQGELPLTSFDNATFPCVFPDEFALYQEEQYAQEKFPLAPFTRKTLLRWAPAETLSSGDVSYVPASMVYAPYYPDPASSEASITQCITTGLACHLTHAQAIIAAICEVIERDAFTITWQARLIRPQLRLETLSESNRDLVDRFERIGSDIKLIDLTMDHGIPTILSALRSGRANAPALVFAASSDLNPEQAVRKSLEELAHTRRLAQILKAERPLFSTSPPYANVDYQDAHVHMYCDPAYAPLAEFIFSSEKYVDLQQLPNLATGNPELDAAVLTERVSAVGHRIFIADLTTEDVRALGLSVVRAVIPGFHPLFMGHHLRALGGTRLWEVPRRLGVFGMPRESGGNPAPHPFP
jgi:ribosomal protein S12 methylthiotransferase accessory factor